MAGFLEIPELTRKRVLFAFAVAVAADAAQVMLGPAGFAFFDEVIDVATMGLTMWALGFHPLLLPTVVIEFIPIVDMLPTWTGCVAAVVFLRRRGAVSPGTPTPMKTVVSTEPPVTVDPHPDPPPLPKRIGPGPDPAG